MSVKTQGKEGRGGIQSEAHTDITFRSPSRTSRSLRLSSSFLIWAAGSVFMGPRELRAEEAASRVSSRAAWD